MEGEEPEVGLVEHGLDNPAFADASPVDWSARFCSALVCGLEGNVVRGHSLLGLLHGSHGQASHFTR